MHDQVVQLTPGTAIDPGGIGKGLAADIVVDELTHAGVGAVLVNIGGDLRVGGCNAPGGPAWNVAVEAVGDPGRHVATLALCTGAVATSTTERQTASGGEVHHHVIDPRTGCPAVSDLRAVTVVASTAWQADVHATAALVLGLAGGYEAVLHAGLDAVFQTAAGLVLLTPGLVLGAVA